ncbi:MAG TPA: heavy metal translocating P-type ATPase metal-binding domain-containing protein [Candidatus Didemnitutus sp.]|nr:heavy metal translocating P-type ATPase metal-binding domain-containing protein [Candidatus Didemnitutus sp.]
MSAATEPLVNEGSRAGTRERAGHASRAASVHHCRHCGSALGTAATRETGFCCAGCAYVFRLVHERGLDGYYRIRDAVTVPADDTVFQPRDYDWLKAAQAAAEQTDRTPELTLEVQGISCAGCVWLIERLFGQQPGALAVEADATLGRIRLRWGKTFDAVAFARELQSFNYVLGPLGSEPAVPESRQLVSKIGLCAAFSMNVMLFTLPVYFGMESTFSYARLFGMLSAGFATLSVLVGGSYFFRRALGALRDGIMHIDLPIAIGILGAYLGSLYGWIAGHEHFIYFDFVAAFILLMLVGRWAQVAAVERNRRRLLSTQLRPEKVTVIDANGVAAVRPLDELRPDDRFTVGPGQVVPVESHLESPTATLGRAWISGEADPMDCRLGARVPSGSVNIGRTSIYLRALQPWREALLEQLLRPAERDNFRQKFLERLVSGYLIGIFAVAIATGVAWWLTTHDAVRTWSAVTAVLVVSCPCAIGLGFPLVDELATMALRRSGVFVRRTDLWPRLAAVRKIIFDKTGTLTMEAPTLLHPEKLEALTAQARAALFALVRENSHPVCQSLHENLLALDLVPAVPPTGEVAEVSGQGVCLRTRDGLWSLGRPGWRGGPEAACSVGAQRGQGTEFACDGRPVASFEFTEAIRSDARQEIDTLKQRGYEICILSGDRREKVETVANAVGVPLLSALGEYTPQDKAAWLKHHGRNDTLMFGDGANDSLAFDAAFVRGTPVVHRGILEAKADFYHLGRGLAGLRRLFEVDVLRRRAQLWLLWFSVGYNLLAVGLAATGHLGPLLAAILMPVNSLVTLALVLFGMRRASGAQGPR